MLAADPIIVELEGGPVVLRPTLRAAIRLERSFGLQGLLAGLHDGSVTVLVNIVTEGSGAVTPCRRATALAGLAAPGLTNGLGAAIEPCFRFVQELYGLNEVPAEDAEAPAETITYADHFERLFSIATGWLGWTPDAALDAPLTDIMEAFHGRQDMIVTTLQAVFGAPSSAPSSASRNDVLDREGLASLRGLGAL